jgi:transcriptional regulator with XRE-family HTH domain
MASRLTFSYTTDTPAKIGAELRAIRQHLALSQRRFAVRLGVHRTSVARWEAGMRPTPITVLRLARLLAEAHVAPPTFMPDPRTKPLSLLPGCECWWQHYGGVECAGAQYQWECVVSRRRHLVTATCLAHLGAVYQLVEAQILAKEQQEAHRQARLAAKREARRKAHEDIVALNTSAPTTT